MSSGALRVAWEQANQPPKSGGGLRAAWEAAQSQPTGIHGEYASGRLAGRMARENANDADALAAEEPSYAQRALGGIAALGRDIPGVEAAQAGVRALTRGQSYTDARNDIRSAEDAANPWVRGLNRVTGGVIGAAALPIKGPAASGAAVGALSGALQSDPNAGIKKRAIDAGVGAAVGAATGKLADAGTNLVRAKLAPSLGSQALSRKASNEAADAIDYGLVTQEAENAGGSSPALRQVMENPDVAPYVQAARDFRQNANASDAKVFREAMKLMNERQGANIKQIANASDFKAGTDAEKQHLGIVKREMTEAAATPTVTDRPAVETAPQPKPSLREALKNFQDRQTQAYTRNAGTIDQQMARRALERHSAENIVSPPLTGAPPKEVLPGVMPSLEYVNKLHAGRAGANEAFQQGADATKRVLRGSQVAGKNLAKKSPEAFLEAILGMSPDAADAALGGVLGRAGESIGVNANPLKGFGAGPALQAGAKIAPLVRALENQRGGANPLVDYLRSLVASEGHPTP